jgi:radical SAM protein with 4Fe4S-binding SPASM domain
MDLLKSRKTDRASIEFTNRCNLRCVYCASVLPGYQSQDLDLSNFDQIVRDLKKRKVRSILANGHGETTLVKNWHMHCMKLLDAGFEVGIITNLSKKLDPKEISVLARLNGIEISCDTVDPDLHAELRKGSDLEVIFSNMKRIRDEGTPRISWSCVVSNRNVYSLPEYVQHGTGIGVDHFVFCNLVDYGGSVQQVSKVDNPKRAISAIEEALNYLRDRSIPFHFNGAIMETLEGSHGQSITKCFSKVRIGQTRDCTDPWNYLQINSKGEVSPCCNHPSIGSLSEDSLQDILNNQKIKDLRKELLTGDLDPFCLECHARGIIPVLELRKKIPGTFSLRLKNLGSVLSSYRSRILNKKSGEN